MLPNLGGMNPRQMQQMMKQLGIKTEEIEAKRIVFELSGGKRLVIENPSVTAVALPGGQKTYTVMGEAKEQAGDAGGTAAEIPEGDVKLVAAQANVSEARARNALEKANGDIAQAIVELNK